ncbi:sulfite exporter TauE/SafE family protein [Brotaphodocola catenula]|uniref:Sulfite exporter TauE/SafE family protein n=1 Tax=Brotaphodocola catenula TaxID=2885361 RepID=A0AAE3ASX7_9FIRM|nr:sulfite exporter TauE/SafE family protein [Brotaphodocola catenula]MCC2165173.1 sulfite exporter TauE/SafE family protein [Brotaphodocola catenula]
MDKTIRLHIGGMTCVNCQNKIEKTLNHTEGVINAIVSYNNATADIVYNEEAISLKEIITAIEKLGYEVIRRKKTAGSNIANTVCMLVIIVSLYVMLQSMGILNLLVPSQLADTKMGYGMLFVIGLITSVHCIAMCGGINLSQCIPQVTQGEADNTSKMATFCPALAYNMGRVLSYTAVGFVLGLVGFLMGGGTDVGFSILLQGILKIIAGLFMVIMGINMLGLFPWLRKFTIRMPKSLVRKVGNQKAKASRPFLVGILNGFMPCGPLQSMWIVALAAGNPFAGALSMFLFSLGTVPFMLGLGSIVSVLGRRFTDQVMRIGAVLVVVLGLAMLSQGGSLSGWISPDLLLVLIIAFCIVGVLFSIPVENRAVKSLVKAVFPVIVVGAYALWIFQGRLVQNSSAAENNAEVVDGVQVVSSTLQAGRYPNITVQAGVPVKWVIDAPDGSINGCNNRILISDYGIEYTFHTGENVIEFTPVNVGTVRYSCWMGMIRGNIFVMDGTGDDIAASSTEVSVPTPAGYTIPTETLAIALPTTDESGNEIQEVSIELTDNGFSPAVIVVQRDLPVYWNIENSLTDAENGTNLLAPYYSTQLALGSGDNLLSLYPSESFDVSTGDNRFYCYVKVVDDLSVVDESTVQEEVNAYEPLIYPSEVFESSGMSCCSQ